MPGAFFLWNVDENEELNIRNLRFRKGIGFESNVCEHFKWLLNFYLL